MKQKILVSLLFLVSILLASCTSIDLLQPGEQVERSTWVSLQNGNIDPFPELNFYPVTEEEALTNNPHNLNSAYIYVAELKKAEIFKNYLFSAPMTTSIDHKQNIKDSGYEIVRIWYYLVEFKGLSEGIIVNNVQNEAVQVVKEWCTQNAFSGNYYCAMP